MKSNNYSYLFYMLKKGIEMKSDYRILFADDEESIRDSYSEVLGAYFKEVIEAKDGKEAYDRYIERTPDIVLLDVRMPIMTGLEVAAKIRQTDKKTKIIIVSAFSEKEMLLEACELHLMKYIIKPITFSQLDVVLNQAIEELDTETNKKDIVKLARSLSLDKKNMVIYDHKKQVKLTRNEIKLIKLLLNKPNLAVSNADILSYVWEDKLESEFDLNKVRVLVYRLNKKLSTDIINSSYGMGYQLSTM